MTARGSQNPHPGCFNRQPSKPGYWTGGGTEKRDGVMVTRAVWVPDRGSPECHILDEPRCNGCKHQPKDAA